MTLATLCQRVVDEVGLPRQSSIASSNDQLARQLFAFANTTIEELNRKTWPCMEIPYTFDTVVGQDVYNFPTDWKRTVVDTVYNSAVYYNMRGSLTAADWYRQRNGLPANLGRYKYRIYGRPLKIFLTPTPQVAETLVFDYVSAWPVMDGGDEIAKPLFAQDSDTSIIPEALVRMGVKWRILHAKGLEYAEAFNEYEAETKIELAQQLGFGSQAVAVRPFWAENWPYYADGYVPETGFGS